MKAEIIAVGTELLLGQVINSNAAYIARELASTGIDCYFHTVVGDNPKRLRQAIEIARDRADVLIFSGGLGPTQDDITKHVIADVINVPLVDDPVSQGVIETYYKKRQQIMPESNKNQSKTLKGSTLLPNENGMAPGSLLKKDGIYYGMVPGVPREMEVMVTNHLIPALVHDMDDIEILESRMLRFFNITESQLAEELNDIIESQTNPTIAIYVDGYEVTVRLSAKAQTITHANKMLDRIEEAIMLVVGEHFYGYGQCNLIQQVTQQLDKVSDSLSIFESGLGGMISYGLYENLKNKTLIKSVEISSESQLDLSKEEIESIAHNFRKTHSSTIGLACHGWAQSSARNGLPTKILVSATTGNDGIVELIDLSYYRFITAEIIQLHVVNIVRKIIY